MDLFCWNIRGLNDLVKRRGFRKWLRKNKPVFGGLLETHVQPNKAAKLLSSVPTGWNLEGNYEFSDLGKIWLIWHPTVKVQILSKSLQMVSCCVKLPHMSADLIVSFIYGSNCVQQRRLLWEEIECFSASPLLVNAPWMLLVDFNEIISTTEHSNADPFSCHREMRDFKECLQRSSLTDLPFCGEPFT